MDTRELTETLVADLDPLAQPVVAGYLREFAAALPGSRRARQAIVTEIADGLIEQITNATGPDPAAAAESAVHAFGSPRNLATRFARELTGKTAHRTGFALISSGPLIGAVWLLALTSGPSSDVTVTLPKRITGLFAALPLIPLLLMIISDDGRGLVTAADPGRHDQHGPAQPGRRGGATVRPAPGRRLTAPFRINAHHVSGTPTSVGNTQYATAGSRSQSGS